MYEHMPKKNENTMLSMKIDLTNMLIMFSIRASLYYFSIRFLLRLRCTQIIRPTQINAIGGRIIRPLLT